MAEQEARPPMIAPSAEQRIAEIRAKADNAALDWRLQSDEPCDLIDDLRYVLDLLASQSRALEEAQREIERLLEATHDLHNEYATEFERAGKLSAQLAAAKMEIAQLQEVAAIGEVELEAAVDCAERWGPVPVPLGDGRHDIGDDVRAAITHRLESDWAHDPDLSPENVRQLAMWAAASVRSLLHELGTLRDQMEQPTIDWQSRAEQAEAERERVFRAGWDAHRDAQTESGPTRDADEAWAEFSTPARPTEEP